MKITKDEIDLLCPGKIEVENNCKLGIFNLGEIYFSRTYKDMLAAQIENPLGDGGIGAA